MAQHLVYRFYAELRDYEPKIWRRFEINGEKTMAELGYAVMIMFEMHASHLFCIRQNMKETLMTRLGEDFPVERMNETMMKYEEYEMFKDIRYELPIGDIYLFDNERLIEANDIKLSHVTKENGIKFSLEYDYGDSWKVDLKLEKCEKKEVSLSVLPRVVDGEGYGIVEDVGGVGGLEELAYALEQGKGQSYEDFISWLGTEDLSLSKFDKEEINFRLKKLIRVYRDIYEYHYQPTENSLKLLLRE